MRLSLRPLLVSASILLLAGCINDPVPMNRPAALDYQHIAPLSVSAGQVEIINHFHPSMASDKAASVFPTRPENALNHYAENRLKASGYEGTLQFIIEDATVRQSEMQSDNGVMKMAGAGVQDRYDVAISVKLARTGGDGRNLGSAMIKLDRYITVPRSYSIAKRNSTLKDFTSKMVEEMDSMVTSSLQDRMQMVVSDSKQPSSSTVSSGPSSYPSDGLTNEPPSLPVPTVHPEALPPPW